MLNAPAALRNPHACGVSSLIFFLEKNEECHSNDSSSSDCIFMYFRLSGRLFHAGKTNTNLIQPLETANCPKTLLLNAFEKGFLRFVVMKINGSGHNHGVNVKFNSSSKRECAVTRLNTHCLKNGWATRPNDKSKHRSPNSSTTLQQISWLDKD